MDRLQKCNFEIYWNVPTETCNKFNSVNFLSCVPVHGICQNVNDRFRGDKIAILYKTGKFPTFKENGEEINGGLPHKANLKEHLDQYVIDLNLQIPDKNFAGLAIIDFEEWKPIFRQNWGLCQKYKDRTLNEEMELHPDWSKDQVYKEAQRKFEESAKNFFEETLKISKVLRPFAKWGYYGFPYCFNNEGQDFCKEDIMKENDGLSWLFKHADAIFPSVYIHEKIVKPELRASFVKGRVNEAVRISKQVGHLPIYVYISYKYADTSNLLSVDDLLQIFTVAKTQGSTGVIIWGSSIDINTEEKAKKLQDYLEQIMGPISNLFSKLEVSVNSM